MALHLKRFASSGDTLIVHHRDSPQWRRNEYASQWVARMRWMPRSAAAVTSARVSAARLASSRPLRLAHCDDLAVVVAVEPDPVGPWPCARGVDLSARAAAPQGTTNQADVTS